MTKNRERWIDCIKIFACVLVVLGHFLMSMVTSGLIVRSKLYEWFVETIYYVHVPLFFMCSGYLYQKNGCVNSFTSWKRNIQNRAVVLGIPYFVFSAATWLLKEWFSGSVNTRNEGFFRTLFLHPEAPYWYLYVLFVMFAITPTFSGKKQAAAGLLCSIAVKCIQPEMAVCFEIYAVSQTMKNIVWFVAGMCLCKFRVLRWQESPGWMLTGGICAVSFVGLSLIGVGVCSGYGFWSLMMGTLGCAAVVVVSCIVSKVRCIRRCVHKMAKYTLPIYLMHTMFAAGLRAALLKLGIAAPGIHILLGLCATFVGPIMAAGVLQKVKLDFVYQPGKYIAKKK